MKVSVQEEYFYESRESKDEDSPTTPQEFLFYTRCDKVKNILLSETMSTPELPLGDTLIYEVRIKAQSGCIDVSLSPNLFRSMGLPLQSLYSILYEIEGILKQSNFQVQMISVIPYYRTTVLRFYLIDLNISEEMRKLLQ